MKDWQIAEAAEEKLKPVVELVAELGLQEDEWTPYGRVLAKVDVTRVLKRVGAGRKGNALPPAVLRPSAVGGAPRSKPSLQIALRLKSWRGPNSGAGLASMTVWTSCHGPAGKLSC